MSFGNLKLYCVTLLQTFVAFRSDRAVVYKNIGPIRAPDEAVSFCIVKPLYRSFQTFHAKPLPSHVLQREDLKGVPTYDAFCSD